MDASYLLNRIDRADLSEKFPLLVPLGDVCCIENESVSVQPNVTYNYLEVPDISETTGVITNIRRIPGKDLNQSSFHKFHQDQQLFPVIHCIQILKA